MVKRVIFIPLFLLLFRQPVSACDACGCSLGGNGIGLLTAYRNNYLGIGWQLARFESVPGPGIIGSTDYFNTLELSVRYHLSERFKLLLYQPFRLNKRINIDQTEQQLNGLGDTRLLGAYTLVKDLALGPRTSLFVEWAAGLKFPLGAYNAHIHDTNLPENFNLGNGSWGFLFQPNMVLTHRQIGLVLGGSYQHHTASSSGYRFGHQLSTQLLFFGEAAFSNIVKLVPNAGITWESTTPDHYANDKPVGGTGGQAAFLTAGINLKVSNWIFGAGLSHPIHQHYSNGTVDAKDRLSLQLSFLF